MSAERGMDISRLPDDVLLHILNNLDTADRIAFAYTCTRFRQICQDPSVLGKVDLSRYLGTQQGVIEKFIRDKIMIEHITELNLNNNSFIRQTDVSLEEFIKSCRHLQVLHVLHCGLSLKSLHRVLQHGHNLTALSWSLMEDIEFMVQDIEPTDDIFLEKIKILHIEILLSEQHLEILRYMVLSRCKCLEELKVCIWNLPYTPDLQFNVLMNINLFVTNRPLASVVDTFRHLHSLTVLTPLFQTDLYRSTYIRAFNMIELSDFVFSVVRKKSRQTKWKRFWISPPLDTRILLEMFPLSASLAPLPEHRSNELGSVEAFSGEGVSEQLISLFQRIKDSVVRNLQLQDVTSINQLLESISRVGGEALQCLSLLDIFKFEETDLDASLLFDSLFFACSNIRELNLCECHFEKNICESLSRLKHLFKIQLQQCAIAPDDDSSVQVNKESASILTFVHSCQNIIDFHVSGCGKDDHMFSRSIADEDLLPLAMWKKLKSFTCLNISSIQTYAFLRNISKRCEFLAMMRISVLQFDVPYINILESAKFLRHLAINVPHLDLGSERVWNLLRHATSLERLCIQCRYEGCLNISGVTRMLESLTRLHVFHLHFYDLVNFEPFEGQVINKLEERSDRISCFEFVTQKGGDDIVYYRKVLPVNISELCYKSSNIAQPTV